MARILINCLDVIGESMAGPAIRSWEFANQLSKNHSITVLSPGKSTLEPTGFEVREYSSRAFGEEVARADFLISQTIRPGMAKLARKYNTRIIVDAYDPITIEALESLSNEEYGLRVALNKILLLEQSASLIFADSIICASEKQRDYWLGALTSLNKLTPSTYDQDSSLRNLIDVVPFGLNKEKPKRTSDESLRKKFALKDTDFVLLWGGGLWNWFDPLSLIKAVDLVKDKVPVKLVFYGIDHPNKNIPRSEMTTKSIELAKKLDLENKSIYFNEGWVPYHQRQQFLLDADVGLSTHLDHLETRFSFRTRILDYIWAELPIVATKGDSFAELIEEKDLGIVVEYQDPASIAAAIERLYSDSKLRQEMKSNLKATQKDFYWEKCVQPLENIIEYWADRAPDRGLSVNAASVYLTNLYRAQKIASKKFAKKVAKKVLRMNP